MITYKKYYVDKLFLEMLLWKDPKDMGEVGKLQNNQ